jgi:hypothetical protein
MLFQLLFGGACLVGRWPSGWKDWSGWLLDFVGTLLSLLSLILSGLSFAAGTKAEFELHPSKSSTRTAIKQRRGRLTNAA